MKMEMKQGTQARTIDVLQGECQLFKIQTLEIELHTFNFTVFHFTTFNPNYYTRNRRSSSTK